MNPAVCEETFVTDDSLHELNDMAAVFFLTTDRVKTEPADVVEQVGHVVVVTSRAPAHAAAAAFMAGTRSVPVFTGRRDGASPVNTPRVSTIDVKKRF